MLHSALHVLLATLDALHLCLLLCIAECLISTINKPLLSGQSNARLKSSKRLWQIKWGRFWLALGRCRKPFISPKELNRNGIVGLGFSQVMFIDHRLVSIINQIPCHFG